MGDVQIRLDPVTPSGVDIQDERRVAVPVGGVLLTNAGDRAAQLDDLEV
jgi:hypothetical protein